MTAEHSLDDIRETAALYALGALGADEARAFEEHLHSGCVACRVETGTFAATTNDLAYVPPPQLPPAALRTRVLERVAADSDPSHAVSIERAGVRFVRSLQVAWEAAAPAVEVKTLSVDHARGYITKLVRMAPGAWLSPHRHADVEESYVHDGDLLVSGVLMRSGDYCRAEAGSVHTGLITRSGCTFIAVCSLRDEVLPDT